MKKFFNNSTKGNETQNKSSKSKRKFLKTFSFTSLALLMGIAGTMAFAPLGASPSVANASEMVDQINTKADGENIKYAPSPLGLDPENDPVIYTTESGLEIKSSNAALTTRSNPLKVYFPMGTYNEYPLNWIIIGWSTDNTSLSTINENITPAGNAILADSNGTLQTIQFAEGLRNVNSAVKNSEIPSGYVLCTTECYLGTDRWSTSDNGGNNQFVAALNSRYTSFSATITEAQKSLIKDNTFFGLSYNGSFAVTTYLTTNAMRISYNIGTTTAGWWWTNQASSNFKAYAINTNGGIDGSSGESVVGRDNAYLGIRPCMLLKIT